MYAWFTAPNATSTLSDVGTYSSAMFDNLVTLLPIAVGFIIGGMIVALLIRAVMKGVKPVLGGRGRRGRGRRR